MSFLAEDEVTKVAFNLITTTISIASSMIAHDTQGVYVYRNPLDDELITADKAAEYQQSYDPKKLRTEVQSDSDEKIPLRSRPYSLAAKDSIGTMGSHTYSYAFNAPQARDSFTPTLGAAGFGENLKAPTKEQTLNYLMSDESSESEEYAAESADVTVADIQQMQQIVYDWPTIADFTLNDTFNTIRRFVGLWKLCYNTKFALLTDTASTKDCLGERHYVTVAFSKPTKRCPNPLAVAYVNFEINYSYVMPHYFPIIVTYSFETYKQSYHVLGKQNMRSISFQNFYIENILNAKLSFYAQIYETTYGPLDQKLREFSVEEEYDMFKQQTQVDLSVPAPYIQPTLSTGLLSKERQTLLHFTRMSAYKHLLNKIEPWNDPAVVQAAHKEMQQRDASLELESKQQDGLTLKKSMLVFGVSEPELQ